MKGKTHVCSFMNIITIGLSLSLDVFKKGLFAL